MSLIAEVLWPHDEQAARAVLARAWDAAAELDAEERRADAAGENVRGEDGSLTDARARLLPKLAKLEPQLAEKYLKEMLREEAESRRARGRADGIGSDPSHPGLRAGRRGPWRELGPEGAWRLELAYALMYEGEFERAAELAAPVVIEGPSANLLSLLINLRPYFARGADEIYRGLLRRTLNDMNADANDVLILSSYVISSDQLVAIDGHGSAVYRSLALPPFTAASLPSAEVPTDMRELFYRVAAAVLMRGSGPSAADTPGDVIAPLFAIERLLPFVEREAPQLAPALHARRAALAQEVDAARRERLAQQSEVRSLTHKNPTDPLASHIESVSRASDEAQRDKLRLHAVAEAARRRLWSRARTLASEIGDTGLRRAAFSVIAIRQVSTVGDAFKDENDPEDWRRAAEFVRKAEVPPLVRAYGFAQAADLAARAGRKGVAGELLGEAVRSAEEARPSPEERFRIFAALTVTASQFDAAQAWELLRTTVVAADGVDAALDESDLIVTWLPDEGSGLGAIEVGSAPSIGYVFRAASRLDFSRAAAESRSLTNPLQRAFAAIGAARAALEKSAGGVRPEPEKK